MTLPKALMLDRALAALFTVAVGPRLALAGARTLSTSAPMAVTRSALAILITFALFTSRSFTRTCPLGTSTTMLLTTMAGLRAGTLASALAGAFTSSRGSAAGSRGRSHLGLSALALLTTSTVAAAGTGAVSARVHDEIVWLRVEVFVVIWFF